jgi:hypothetical protein
VAAEVDEVGASVALEIDPEIRGSKETPDLFGIAMK